MVCQAGNGTATDAESEGGGHPIMQGGLKNSQPSPPQLRGLPEKF